MKPLILLSLVSFQAFAVQIAPFRADVTPPIGAPLCGGLVKPAVGVSEPLLALGVVLLAVSLVYQRRLAARQGPDQR